MLRKIFSTILIVSLLMIESSAMAAYPKYLNGDRNYILFDGHQGVGRYLIRNSLKYLGDDPVYAVSIDWVSVNNADRGSTQISGGRNTYRFGYSVNPKKAYNLTDGRMNPITPTTTRAMGAATVAAAEMTFYLASSGKKFFGIFSDSFYPDL